jgi:hypothetical protein
MGSGKYIDSAIKKYGIKNFTKEVLFIFNNENDMNEKEKELVTEDFVLQEDNYNLCPGGKGGFGYINRTRDHKAHNKKLAEKRNYRDPIFIAKVTEVGRRSAKNGRKISENSKRSFLGKAHKKETKEIIGKKNSIHQKGSKNSQFGTCWITDGIETKKCKKKELDFWLEKGYRKGRI